MQGLLQASAPLPGEEDTMYDCAPILTDGGSMPSVFESLHRVPFGLPQTCPTSPSVAAD